ncbi:hypothetical protein Godav_012109 [Gossypium davidsonii]|uniref:Uncharacterized protein n=1 Tax=Gossypium davidsonii TaxID=34287 RepID=A0A7J8RD01_GOSDV|nr:hypothetical protein [Gossypium davidsonii]
MKLWRLLRQFSKSPTSLGAPWNVAPLPPPSQP